MIIAAFNAEAYIAKVINSARAQSERRLEIIVIDDGSQDATARVAREIAAVIVMVSGILLLPPAVAGSPIGSLIGLLALKVFLGAVLYIGTHAVLWLAAGRPESVGRSLMNMARKLAARWPGQKVS